MWGKRLFGHCARHFDDVFSKGEWSRADAAEPALGGVGAVLLFGDFKQLPPVLDSPLFAPLPNKVSAVDMWGHVAYRVFRDCFLLDTPVRQTQGPLLSALSNLRDGAFSESDLSFWSARQRIFLAAPDWELANPGVIFATCTNRERNELAAEYVRLFHGVCAVKAECKGKHALADGDAKAGMLKSISRLTYLAVGMMVRVLFRISSLKKVLASCSPGQADC
jgi:hypothetical protein